MRYRTFEEMSVWQKARDLAIDIFRITEGLPRKEDYGLTSQIRRSALSVSGNIAEGFGRGHLKDKLNFYYDARGSLCETKNYIIYGKSVSYFTQYDFNQANIRIEIIWKELNFMIANLKSGPRSKP